MLTDKQVRNMAKGAVDWIKVYTPLIEKQLDTHHETHALDDQQFLAWWMINAQYHGQEWPQRLVKAKRTADIRRMERITGGNDAVER